MNVIQVNFAARRHGKNHASMVLNSIINLLSEEEDKMMRRFVIRLKVEDILGSSREAQDYFHNAVSELAKVPGPLGEDMTYAKHYLQDAWQEKDQEN